MSDVPRPRVELSARCACGGAGVSFAGRVLSMFLCSCEDCQRATGTGHSAVILVRGTDVGLDGDIAAFARPANSGATLTRSFCPTCGTPLLARSSRAPHLAMLPAGLFGATAAPWYLPNQLIFARSHRDWDLIDPELPQHATYRDEGALM
ncbi:MAG: GFA family protein [Devosia sp.]